MSTLEDAAEQLVLRLNGLDSEIAQSHDALQELREDVEEASQAVAREWSSLVQAANTFLERLRQEQDHLQTEVRQALQGGALSGPLRRR